MRALEARRNYSRKASFWLGMMFRFDPEYLWNIQVKKTGRQLDKSRQRAKWSENGCSCTWNADPSLPPFKSFLLENVTRMRDQCVRVGVWGVVKIKWEPFPSMPGCEIRRVKGGIKETTKCKCLHFTPTSLSIVHSFYRL